MVRLLVPSVVGPAMFLARECVFGSSGCIGFAWYGVCVCDVIPYIEGLAMFLAPKRVICCDQLDGVWYGIEFMFVLQFPL